MQLEFRVISLVLLLCIGVSNRYVRCYQGPQGVVFTYRPDTDFYGGQRFEFSCEAGTGNGTSYEDAKPSNKPTSIYLTFFTKINGREKELGCNYFGDPLEASVEAGPIIPQWNPLTSDDCGDRDNKLEKITITGNITQAMQSKYSNFSCAAYYKVGEPKISKERLNSIPELKVAPQNLTLTLSSDFVEEGKQFNFSCESVGGNPSSTYTYKLRRNSDNKPSDLEDTFYVPTRQDREGLNISCTDESHINYPGPNSNIIKWMHVMPQYLEFKDNVGKETVKTVVLDKQTPPSINLSCDVFVSSEGLGHAWSFNGLDLKEWEDKITIGLNTSDLKNGDKADCKVGFADGHTSKQYSWIFRRSQSKQLPWLPIVLGSVAAVVLIVAVSLVLCCKRKPQARNVPKNTVASRGDPLATNKPHTQRGEYGAGMKIMTPADQSQFQQRNQTPTMMHPAEVRNTLLQQQYIHDQQMQQMEYQRLHQYSRGQPEGQDRVFVFHTEEV